MSRSARQADPADRTDFYLRKEAVGTPSGERFTIPFWEHDKSYRFTVSKRRLLTSPVADFGCGHGPLTILTARLGLDVTGIDCVHENLVNGNRLRHQQDRARFVEAMLGALPVPDRTFASGLLKEVLEHIVAPDIPAVLAEIRRVLRPGALLIVTVPRETILSRNVSTQHVTFFGTPAVLAKVLARNGFRIVRREYNRIYKRICVVARVPD